MAIDDNASYELTGYQVKDLASKIRAKADSSALASVATSGLYSDLTGAPTIPTVYNGTLTIQQNGTTLGTFSANQSSNETINITGGGGAGVTTFHWGGSPNYSMYKDSGYATPATYSDIATAYADGLVYIADGEDEVTYVMVSDIPDAYTITVTGIALPGYEGGSTSYAYASSTWTKTATEFQKKLTAGTNISISGSTISATDTTYSDFTGATSSIAGTAGLVPAPAAGDEGKALHGDGTWKDTTAKLVEMSYGESNAWAKFIAAYSAGSIVYCRASSNANPGTGSQTRKAFMAYVNNATSPTSVEFQYVRSQSSKSDSQQCDQVFVYTLTNTGGGTWSVASRDMATKVNVDSTLNKTYSSGANASMTLGAKAMTGATSGAAGAAGIVPAPAAGDQDKVLTGDGTWKALTNVLYPIGSIYMSATLATAADVEAALGGTWVAWGAGKVPVGVDTGDTDFDTAEETGGAKTHTHGLSGGYAKLNIRGNGQIPYREKSVASWTSNYRANADSGTGDSQSSSYGIELGGSTDSGSTMPPYITCYMYKRTA